MSINKRVLESLFANYNHTHTHTALSLSSSSQTSTWHKVSFNNGPSWAHLPTWIPVLTVGPFRPPTFFTVETTRLIRSCACTFCHVDGFGPLDWVGLILMWTIHLDCHVRVSFICSSQVPTVPLVQYFFLLSLSSEERVWHAGL